MSGKKYICELCKKEFKQKSDFQKHSNKKTPCISLNEIQKITQTRESSQSNLSNLTTIFKYCLDVLRDNEHLTGDKALRTLAHLLDLRLLEHQFGTNVHGKTLSETPGVLDEPFSMNKIHGKTIDIDNYDYDFSDYGFTEEEELDHKTTLLQIVRFSKLAESKEANLSTNMKYLWKDILSVHPKTKNIFLEGKGFDITNQSTYKKLITKLNSFDFESIEEDVLGEAYEEVIKDVMIGKTLGQFFTPPKVKKMMVKLIDPQVKEDGTIEKIFDPAMGTGGFLINCLRHLITQSKVKNINLDWEFIRKFGLGGREAEPDTYQLAVSNMLISSGQMFDEELLQKGDSIRDPITNKYDIILANPPFGIDGLDYTNIEHNLRNEYMPIKSNSAVPLFLQAIIYMLRIGGRCAVVLPEGQELFSKNKALSSVREFLMKTCDLKEVIYLPAGTFTHTSIKTCVFYFVKKRECHEALKIKIKTSKVTNKETDREYNFSKTHQTTKVHFYDYNPDNDVKHLLLEVPIEELSKNSYSLNYAEYLKDTIEEESYEDGMVIKTLEEVCEINYGTRIVKKKNIKGDYPVFGSGRETFTTNKFNRDGFNILIGRFALSTTCVRLVNHKLFLNDSGLSIQPKNNKLLHKYIAYYFFENQNIIYSCARGTAQKNLDMDQFKKLKIPLPSLEKQKEIVSYLDFIYGECNKTSENKITELKKLNEYCLNNQKVFGDNEIKTLGEICDYKSGKRLPIGHQIQNTKTKYPYIRISDIDKNTISIKNIKYISEETKNIIKKYIITTNDIYVTIAGTTGLVGIIPDELNNANLTENAIRLIIKNKNYTNQKYLMYEIKYNQQKEIKTKSIGAAIPKLSIERLMTLKISIPSLEKQKEIVEYCEFNHNLIKQLENEIEQNKIQAKLFLSSIVKKVVSITSDNEETNSDEDNEDKTNSDEDKTNSDEDDESDSEYEYITYKNKEYILEDDNVYNINGDGSKGLIFGTYNNNKVKRIKSEVNIVV